MHETLFEMTTGGISNFHAKQDSFIKAQSSSPFKAPSRQILLSGSGGPSSFSSVLCLAILGTSNIFSLPWAPERVRVSYLRSQNWGLGANGIPGAMEKSSDLWYWIRFSSPLY